MKPTRYIATSLSLVLLAGAALNSSGCTFARRVIGKDKLNQGTLAFNQGKTAEAKEMFKVTTDLMPDNPTAWLYYGATLFKEFGGASQDDKKAKGQEALNAYNKALELSGNAKDPCRVRDNAIGYISSIYDQMGESDKHREWLLKRADGPCATDKIKAVTYYSIAVQYWKCAYDQSTRYADKAKLTSDPFHIRNFYFKPDKDKFDDCLNKGFEYIEKSLSTDPNYIEALSYKSLLYREKQKASSNEAERKKFEDEAKKLAEQVIKLTKEQKAKEEAAAAAEAAASASPKK